MKRILPILAAALALTGCVATQKDMLDLENQTDELKHQVTELRQTISSMQANQADLLVKLQSLHGDLATFGETMRQSQDGMSQLASKIDDLGATIGNKVAAIGTNLATTQAKGLAEQKATLDKQEEALANQLQQGTPTDLFHAAEVRLAKKSYDLAAKGFEDYLNRYPKGALADLAAYNLGESYFGLKKWELAGRQYGIYLEKYPKSNLVASARLMYALCLVNMRKNLAEAKQYLESVIADFPASPEAKAAAGHLRKLPAGKKQAP
ncbi:MAG: tetratricopeptide repeat protein [Elusimicrobiota bacterium]|jgi:tol-pal system protein YbgF